MEDGPLNWTANVIRGIADDVLRNLCVRGKSRDVILLTRVRYETATSGQRSLVLKLVVDADVPVLILWAMDVP